MGNLRHRSTQIVYGRMTLVATFTVFIAAFLSLAALPPRPERPLPPNVAAIQLQFSNIQDSDAQLWAEVEWLAGDGNWVVTDGWRGTPDILSATAQSGVLTLGGEQIWWVGASQYGASTFRWHIYNEEGGQLIATSEQFTLPSQRGSIVVVSIDGAQSTNDDTTSLNIRNRVSSKLLKTDVCFATADDGANVFSSADHTAVQNAVEVAPDNGTVKIAGTCAGSTAHGPVGAVVTATVVVSKNLTLRGGYLSADWATSDPPNNPTTLDALRAGIVIHVNPLMGPVNATFENLSIKGAGPSGGTPGGGIFSQFGSSIVLNNVDLFDNIAASGNGGGLFMFGGSLQIANSRIYSNSAESGGGISTADVSVTVTASEIYSNSAMLDGGGFFVNSSTVQGYLTVTNGSKIYGNHAAMNGGGIYFGSTLVTLDQSTIANNRTTTNLFFNAGGGGLFGRVVSDPPIQASLTITNSARVEYNHSETCGGGLFNLGPTVDVWNSTFAHNSSTCGGGGLFIGDGLVTLNATNVHSNTSSTGGGLFVIALADGGGARAANDLAADYSPYTVNLNQPEWGPPTLQDAPTVAQEVNGLKGDALPILTFPRTAPAHIPQVLNVTINDSDFGYNRSDLVGGGVMVLNTIAMLNRTTVHNNTTGFAGGGVYIASNAVLMSDQSVFDSNIAAQADGGGIFSNATLIMDKSTVQNNRAGDDGGGISASHATILRNGWLIRNTAGISPTTDFNLGGGIDTLQQITSSLVLDNMQVLSNTVLSPNGWGGGVSAGGPLTAQNSVIAGNVTWRGGGGLMTGWTGTSTNLMIRDNISLNSNGGGYVHGNGTHTMTHSTLTNNSAQYGGGFSSWSHLVMQNNTVENNRALQEGGGLITYQNLTELHTTTVKLNSADLAGGAATVSSRGVLNLFDSAVMTNTAPYGAGVDNFGFLYLLRSRVEANRATRDGGGLYNDPAASMVIAETQILGNHADRSGGGIMQSGSVTSTLFVANSTIANNSAVELGGGIYHVEGSTFITGTRLLDNTSPNGGAIYQESHFVRINQSCIVGNSHTSAVLAGSGTLDATTNWWGYKDGPSLISGVADSITANVNGGQFHTSAIHGCRSAHEAWMPVILNAATFAPDLIVDSVTFNGAEATVVIKNIGLAASNDDFWVDLLLNPASVPAGVNDVVETIGSQGHVWGVTRQVAAGESITLTVNDAYYSTESSDFPSIFQTGDVVYTQVDSASTDSPTVGGVLEIHEIRGGTYNNILRSVVP